MSKRDRSCRLIVLGVMIVALSFQSCSKTDEELNVIAQEERIDSYLENLVETENQKREDEMASGEATEYYPEFLEVELIDGARRVVMESVKDGEGLPLLSRGDSVYFYYGAYLFNNGPSSLFSTNDASLAESGNLNLDDMDFTLKKMLYDSDNFVDGLYSGLDGVRQGDILIVLFSSKYGYGNSALATVPKMSSIYYLIHIEKIIKNR